LGSSDRDGTITSYGWNFGDATTSSGVSVSHTYTLGGTYNVSLTITDNYGGIDTEAKAVIVGTNMNASFLSPAANFPTTSCTGSGKDKHLFYNYAFSIPAVAMINGIEVRLDAKVDSTLASPKLCVQLSWNGGAN
jgi:PKD repeat protein